MSRYAAVAVAAVLALLCAAPVRADRIDTAFEKAIGPLFAQQFSDPFGVDKDPLLAGYVSRVGGSVAKESYRTDLRCRFIIVGSDTANAFTLPGGYIMVTRGLLDEVESDDELGSVLAHETGHVAKRHATQQIGFNVGFTVLRNLIPHKTLGSSGDTLLAVYSILRTLNKSKEQEAQADEEGIKFAYAAGYDPDGLVQFFDGLGSYHNRIEEYFSTHPSPQKRIADAKKSPLVLHVQPEEREHVAAGYAVRGLPGLAERVRHGQDPFAYPPDPVAPPVPDYLVAERKAMEVVAQKERNALVKSYSVSRAANIAQQFLLLNTQLNDARWIYLSGRAYAVQSRLTDIYSRSARVLRTTPGTWDALVRQSQVAPLGSSDRINGNLGRGEVEKAVDLMQGVATPLSRAQTATAAVLFDLNNRFVRLNNDTTWARYGALEATLRYAESELDRADARSARAWRILSVARIRRYEAAINELVPETDIEKRIVWNDLLQRRIGAAFPTEGPTGLATIKAMMSVSLSDSATELYAKRDPDDFAADWVFKNDKVQPENIATALRLTALELDRELAAREQYKSALTPSLVSFAE